MKFKDFIETPHTREWLIKGLIPKGHVVLIAGLPGVGKSWIVDAIAIHIASGKPFLELPVIQGQVTLIDEDTPTDELLNRLERLAKGLNINADDLPLEVHSMENFNLNDDKSLQKLEQEVSELKPTLVILDCLSQIMGGDFNEDSAKDANKAGRVWNILKSTGATVFVTHHLNKREGNLTTDFVKLLRGSGALVANSDTAFGIELRGNNPTRFNIYPVVTFPPKTVTP